MVKTYVKHMVFDTSVKCMLHFLLWLEVRQVAKGERFDAMPSFKKLKRNYIPNYA